MPDHIRPVPERTIRHLNWESRSLHFKKKHQQKMLSKPLLFQGYGDRDSYVITQMPFPDTMKDIWRILDDTGISTIVMMNMVDDTYEVGTQHSFWDTL